MSDSISRIAPKTSWISQAEIDSKSALPKKNSPKAKKNNAFLDLIVACAQDFRSYRMRPIAAKGKVARHMAIERAVNRVFEDPSNPYGPLALKTEAGREMIDKIVSTLENAPNILT